MPSLRLGSCGCEGQLAVCRALAADALADGRVVVLLAECAAQSVIAALRETGQAALLANSPRTNRTLHLKGRDARVEPALPEHASLLALRHTTMASEIGEMDGFANSLILGHWYGAAAHGVAAVYFNVSGAWDQTPGPHAGQPVALEDMP